MAFSIVCAVMCLFFVYAAIRPPSKFWRYFQNIFMVPLFVLMVVLSWVFAIVFVIGSVGLADMCIDSPDENFQALMKKIQDEFDPLIFKAIIFYVSGMSPGTRSM